MNQFRPWTPEEDATLAQMRRENCCNREIADRLHRTMAGIKARSALLALNGKRIFRNSKWWSPQEIELAQELLKDPKSDTMLMLGRTRQACRNKMTRVTREPLAPRRELFDGPRAAAVVPPEVIEERNRQYMAELSLTERFCGDPGPLRSALAQRQSA